MISIASSVFGFAVGSPAPVLPSTVDCSVGGFHQIRQPFVWRDEASGTEVLADYHPGGYGGVLPLNPDDKHDERWGRGE